MTKRVILHVGMHKTGTTFLQKDVFPNIPDVYYADDDLLRNTLLRLIQENPVTHDLEAEKKILWDYIETLPQSNVIISYEGLFGHHHNSYQNNWYMTELLHQLFPEAQIFLMFRRQDDWLESLYYQTLSEGRSFSVSEFLNYRNAKFEPFRPVYCLNGTFDIRLNPVPFIQNYQRVFGAENVFALPYELFKNDSDDFYNRFYTFFNLQPYFPPKVRSRNRSFSMLSSQIVRYMNKIVKDKEQQAKIKQFLRRQVEPRFYTPAQFISEELRTRIMEMHKADNHQLSQLIGLELGQYGYY